MYIYIVYDIYSEPLLQTSFIVRWDVDGFVGCRVLDDVL